MKKLLAIAVTAALTAPMLATAEVKVGGQMRLEMPLNGASKGHIVNKGGKSKFTLGGSSGLDNGMAGTYAFTGKFNPNGGAGLATSGKIGIKGGFGHVTLGSVDNAMDQVDGNTGFLPTSGRFGDGNGSHGINYTGAFGPLGVYAMARPKQTAGTKNQLGVTYKTGPFSVGAAISKSATASDSKNRISLAYSAGDLTLGANIGKSQGGAKTNSIGAKYSMGKAYVAASFGKKSGAKHNGVEVGYSLGSKTRVYLLSTKATSGRSNLIGLEQKF